MVKTNRDNNALYVYPPDVNESLSTKYKNLIHAPWDSLIIHNIPVYSYMYALWWSCHICAPIQTIVEALVNLWLNVVTSGIRDKGKFYEVFDQYEELPSAC